MNASSNPFSSPETAALPQETDVQKLTKVARQLLRFRYDPPSISGMLLKPAAFPLRIFVAAICISLLTYISLNLRNGLGTHWPVAMAAFFAGSMLRDVSYARVYAKWWPANAHFMNWERIEAFATEDAVLAESEEVVAATVEEHSA